MPKKKKKVITNDTDPRRHSRLPLRDLYKQEHIQEKASLVLCGGQAKTGSACLEAWITASLPYASSSEPPPLLLFASLYGNPDSPSPQQRSEARPKYRNPCSPCSPFARQTAFSLSPSRDPTASHPCLPSVNPPLPACAAPLAHPRQLPRLQRCLLGSRGQTGKGHLHPELFSQSEHIKPLCSPCPPPSPLCAFTQTHPLPAMSYIYRSFASATAQTVFNSSLRASGRKSRNYITQQKNVLHKPFFVIIFCNRCVV